MIDYASKPGPHLTPEFGVELMKAVTDKLADASVSGAVVLQGTDTLEEMAYLSYLVTEEEKPIVFTGAMKSKDELYVDAPGNLYGAVRVAENPNSRGRGTMVYLDQQIHSARYVSKVDANCVDAFQSVMGGPIGGLYNDEIIYYGSPERVHHYPVSGIHKRVEIIKAYFGMSPMFLEACLDSKIDGLVIEGLGAGNLPPYMLEPLQRVLDRGIPVVMVTRCSKGLAMDVYDYSGGGAQLKKMGVIYGGMLSGQKARIKLLLLLERNSSLEEIRAEFMR